MWNDPIETALLKMREALHAIQRGHLVHFGELRAEIEKALAARADELRVGKVTRP
jgi:hypothetical protein